MLPARRNSEPMLSAKRLLGAPILLTASFLITVVLFLYSSDVTTHLIKVSRLNGIWRSQDEIQPVRGNRLVVFGDSWVDNKSAELQSGPGKRWTDALCAEMECVSHLNLATSQAPSAFPSVPPSGVVVSNDLHQVAQAKAQLSSSGRVNFTQPDFAAQVRSYIALPAISADDVRETIFVISLGFWDIYHYASLEYTHSTNIVDASIAALFGQLNILFAHLEDKIKGNEGNTTFRVVIPKVLDPTIAPGWQTQRPLPIAPSSFAEQQKNAVYLTERWNNGVENKLGAWMRKKSSATNEFKQENATDEEKKNGTSSQVERAVFYYDLPSYVLDQIIERSFEIEGMSDAHGLGKGTCPFTEVYLSCVSDDAQVVRGDESDEYEERDGKWVCKNPKEYLWWDGWSLSDVASEEIGKKVAVQVKSDDRLSV